MSSSRRLAFEFGTAVAVTVDPTTYKLDVLSYEISASRRQGFQLSAIQLHGVRNNQMHRICQVDKVEAKFVRCATESTRLREGALSRRKGHPELDGTKVRWASVLDVHIHSNRSMSQPSMDDNGFNQNQLAPARTK
ncbi:hypothetical protein R3P38DRAFT_3370671 [Favolaschia claudopus]|uniref:Uncharacterized protein n=1 Tax=Favolaschia claudopus TaxID=2862362 RepID=A0AAW0A1J7_9AGAR